MDKQDFHNELALLYLLYISDGIHSRVRLQKLVCLIQFTQKKLSPFSFQYKSHYYGPYSELLRKKLDDLFIRNLIDEKTITKDEGEGWSSVYSYFYCITEKGKEVLKSNLKEIERGVGAIDAVLDKYGQSSTELIIRAALEFLHDK